MVEAQRSLFRIHENLKIRREGRDFLRYFRVLKSQKVKKYKSFVHIKIRLLINYESYQK
jgi:hypothetical protein